jgi:anti-sigma B factor antagonist
VATSAEFPVRWLGDWAVITAPGEIDISNSPQLGMALLSVARQGAVVLIVDMSATTFCDSSGMTALALALARKQAVANGVDIRLVITHAGPRRALELLGLDVFIRIYPGLAAALSGLAGHGPRPQ